MKQKYRKKDKESFFYFSASQRRGLFVLVALIMLVGIGFFVCPYFIKETAQTDFSSFEKQIALYEQDIKTSEKTTSKFDSKTTSSLTPFPFDPNTLSTEKWAALGLSSKQIQTIQNYLAKGGKYRQKEDFKKMYCISNDEYRILAPYIHIASDTKLNENNETVADKGNHRLSIELNTADTLALQELKGIGSVLAVRITKYRALLGGFYKTEQLLEVYGITPETFTKIKNNVAVNPTLIRKTNINSVSIGKLKKHPYMTEVVAKAIIDYRGKSKVFNTIDDFKNIVDASAFEKLKPYITIE